LRKVRKSKYDAIKQLIRRNARVEHTCYRCNKIIQGGEQYYKEDVGRINKPSLRDFCSGCYSQLGDNLLQL